MSFEGTTNPVVVETVVSPAAEVETNTTETNETDSPEVDENGEEVSPPAPVDDTEEVDYEGQKVRVPKSVKEALLRHADYTQKTQQLAEQRRAFEATRLGNESVNKEYVDALATVKAYDGYLANYANRTDADWTNLEIQDPVQAGREWRHFTQLKEGRTQAVNTANEKQHGLEMETQRIRATRFQEVQAELKKSIPEWAPGNDLDQKLAKYGTASGMSAQDLADATLRNPAFVTALNKARLWDEAQTKQANTKRIEAAQAVKPAAEVGSRSTTTTKDPAKMDHAAYRKWRASQG